MKTKINTQIINKRTPFVALKFNICKSIVFGIIILSFLCCKKEKNIEVRDTIPAAPSNLDYTITREKKDPFQSARINLKWSDNSNNETTFIIERKNYSSSRWERIISTSSSSVSLSISTYLYANNTKYYRQDSYRVCAKNSAGESGYSNVITVENIDFRTGICTKCID